MLAMLAAAGCAKREEARFYELIDHKGHLFKVGAKEAFTGVGGMEVEISRGKFHGELTEWHPNGRKAHEAEYRQGKKHGAEVFWFENGQKQFEGRFSEDQQDGRSVHWFDNGQKERRANYQAGMLNGEEMNWHRNGKVMLGATWQNGKLVEAKCFDTMGNLTGEVKEGNGKVYSYWPNGDKRSDDTFVKGVRHGTSLFWHDNGQLGKQAPYQAGKLEGEEYHWHANGRWKWQALYQKGRLVAKRAWTPEGKPIK